MKEIKMLKNNNSGFVILFAMVLSGILLALGLGVAEVAFKEISFSTSAKASNDSFLAADTGVECALMNDKEGVRAFTGDNEDGVDCLGASIPFNPLPVIGDPISTWRFIIPPGEENYCSIITVTKEVTSYYTKTDIVSKGYNFGDEDDCTSSSPNRIERELHVTYTVGATIATDTFEENIDTFLQDHNPTGINAGSEWIIQQKDGVVGDTIVSHSTDRATENFNQNIIRYKMNDDLGSSQMDISADFTSQDITTSQPQSLFFGLIGRLPEDENPGSRGIEAYFVQNSPPGSGVWVISDGPKTDVTAVEEWPDGTVKMRLLIEDGTATLYVDGIEKVSIDASAFTGQNYAGIMLGNMTGGDVGKITVDNYYSIGFGL